MFRQMKIQKRNTNKKVDWKIQNQKWFHVGWIGSCMTQITKYWFLALISIYVGKSCSMCCDYNGKIVEMYKPFISLTSLVNKLDSFSTSFISVAY